MIRVMLVLKDSKAEMFMTPFFAPTVGVAYRSLMDEMRRGGPENTLASHPEDYQVYRLGTFDDDIGLVNLDDEPELLCEVKVLMEKS